MRAGVSRDLYDTGAQSLARHLEQSKRADPTDLNSCAVIPERILETAFDRMVVPILFHIDKIDDDEASKVA